MSEIKVVTGAGGGALEFKCSCGWRQTQYPKDADGVEFVSGGIITCYECGLELAMTPTGELVPVLRDKEKGDVGV